MPFLSITEQVYDIILKKIFEGEEKYLKRIDSKAEPGIEADDTEKQEKLLLKIIRTKDRYVNLHYPAKDFPLFYLMTEAQRIR